MPDNILEFRDDTGVVRRLGNLPPEKLKFGWNRFGESDATPIIPRSEWKPIDHSPYVRGDTDQDGKNACNGFSSVNVLEGCRAMAGLDYVRLSPGDLYARINGGRDQGSMLEDAQAQLHDGVATAATVPELTVYARDIPRDAAAERPNYAMVEDWLCPTFDAVVSAIQAGFLVNLGILWGDQDRLDGDGWLPSRPMGRQGGHAIAGCGYHERQGKRAVKAANSWTAAFGKKGFFWIPESRFDGSVGGWWACRVVKRPPGGDDFPTPLV